MCPLLYNSVVTRRYGDLWDLAGVTETYLRCNFVRKRSNLHLNSHTWPAATVLDMAILGAVNPKQVADGDGRSEGNNEGWGGGGPSRKQGLRRGTAGSSAGTGVMGSWGSVREGPGVGGPDVGVQAGPGANALEGLRGEKNPDIM